MLLFKNVCFVVIANETGTKVKELWRF